MRSSQLTYADPDDPLWKRLLIDGIERATGRQQIESLYNGVMAHDSPMSAKWAMALEGLRITVQLDRERLAGVPKSGPVIVIANHPFGVVDGLVLLDVLAGLRPDYALLVNAVLCREPRLDPFFLPVSFEETPEAIRTNVETRRQAMARLKNGEALGIFPAGGVATAHGGRGPACDLEWKRFVAKLIHVTKAPVVPLYFEGQNSRTFQVVSQVSQTLRLAMLLHEVRNKSGRTLEVHVGEPMTSAELDGIHRKDLMQHLWQVTHALGGQNDVSPYIFR